MTVRDNGRRILIKNHAIHIIRGQLLHSADTCAAHAALQGCFREIQDSTFQIYVKNVQKSK